MSLLVIAIATVAVFLMATASFTLMVVLAHHIRNGKASRPRDGRDLLVEPWDFRIPR